MMIAVAVGSPTRITSERQHAQLSFAKSLCPTLEGFLPVWRKLFGLGLQADSSTVEYARRERGPRLGRVTRKRVWFSEE